MAVVSPMAIPILQFIVLFLLSWQVIFRISNVAMNTALKFFSILLRKLSDFIDSDKLGELALTY